MSVDRRRVEEICDAALDRAPELRQDYLAMACNGDDDLRLEVEALLAYAPAASAFLKAPVDPLAAVMDAPALPIGTLIGLYEIRSRLGKGGMGEVYRAHDTKLDRDVALKVLSSEFTSNPDRLARFEREARLLASLTHPNIGAIYGVEEAGGYQALILELIEGQTLAEALANGPLPLPRALTIAATIADALDHAHRQGIVHRDLKPSNVMLAKSGVKLLDFGLAKWTRGTGIRVVAPAAATPTAESSLTSEGMILGTLHYMSPEQLEGKDTDARSDIFAFGAVLYELVTGRKAFDGPSQANVIAAILAAPPPIASSLQLIPPRLGRVVARCLARDPDERWQSAADLATEMRWLVDDADARLADRPRDALTRRRNQRATAWGAAVLVAVLAAGWIFWTTRGSRGSIAARPPVRLTLRPPDSAAMALAPGGLSGVPFDIAPDGSQLVYVGLDNGRRRLFVWRFDQFEPVALSGTDGALSPTFAPDSRWVAFVVREQGKEDRIQERIKKIDTRASGAPVVLGTIDRSVESGAAFLDDGSIAFGVIEKGVHRLPAEGGELQVLTTIDAKAGEQDHHMAQLLPHGRLLLDVHLKNGAHRIAVENLQTHERRVVIADAFDARYLPSGHIVFGRGEEILAVPFDLDRLATTGSPIPLVDHVATFPRNGWGAFRVSSNGTLVFQPSPSTDQRTLVWVSRSGGETPLSIPARAFTSPRISPDGTRIAFALEGGPADTGSRGIWVYELANGKITRVTDDGLCTAPVWTPDGARLVYSQRRDGRFHLILQSADRIGGGETLLSDEVMLVPAAWTPDQSTLIYWQRVETDTSHLFALRLAGDRKPKLLVADARAPRLSPDGRWLAFTSALGRTQVAVVSFPVPGSRQQVSTNGGREPVWSADGRTLFYRNSTNVFGASVAASGSIGRPEILFTGQYMINGTFSLDYDVAADGRMLMVKRGEDELAPAALRAVLNWIDELAVRVPSGGGSNRR